MYYCGVNDEFKDADKKRTKEYDGKTLNASVEDGAIIVDKPSEKVNVYGQEVKATLSEDAINSYVKYALKVSEKAAERLMQGVIVPYPIADECKYCKFKSMCNNTGEERKIGGVNTETIVGAVNPSPTQE